jgi:hypothetical protein
MDVGPGGTTVEGAARQGRLIAMIDEAAAAGEGSIVPAGGVAGLMPGYLRYFKWGGRVFLVIGIVSVPAEIALTRPEDRTRTAVGATAGFVGGLAAGAAAGLVCGPGALVCSVVLGIAFGIAGSLASREAAESIYDAATSTGTPVPWSFDPETARALESPSTICPSCHRTSAPASGSFTGFPTTPSTTSLSAEDMRIIIEYLAGPTSGH